MKIDDPSSIKLAETHKRFQDKLRQEDKRGNGTWLYRSYTHPTPNNLHADFVAYGTLPTKTVRRLWLESGGSTIKIGKFNDDDHRHAFCLYVTKSLPSHTQRLLARNNKIRQVYGHQGKFFGRTKVVMPPMPKPPKPKTPEPTPAKTITKPKTIKTPIKTSATTAKTRLKPSRASFERLRVSTPRNIKFAGRVSFGAF